MTKLNYTHCFNTKDFGCSVQRSDCPQFEGKPNNCKFHDPDYSSCLNMEARRRALFRAYKDSVQAIGYSGEKVHAEPSPTGSFTNYYCPQCKDRQLLHRFNFCPDCGLQLNWEDAK